MQVKTDVKITKSYSSSSLLVPCNYSEHIVEQLNYANDWNILEQQVNAPSNFNCAGTSLRFDTNYKRHQRSATSIVTVATEDPLCAAAAVCGSVPLAFADSESDDEGSIGTVTPKDDYQPTFASMAEFSDQFYRRRQAEQLSHFEKLVNRDIDLHWITDRLCAMVYPDDGTDIGYSCSLPNTLHKLANHCYSTNVQFFNLSEPIIELKNYKIFDFGWPANIAPSIEIVCKLLQEMCTWLENSDSKLNNNHVVILHCKKGTDRLVTFVSMLLKICNCTMILKNLMDCTQLQHFLNYYQHITKNPSQIRYIQYISNIFGGTLCFSNETIYLKRIIFDGVPNMHKYISNNVGSVFYIKIYKELRFIHSTSILSLNSHEKRQLNFGIKSPLPINGNILIKCFHLITGSSKNNLQIEPETIFCLQFNTSAVVANRMLFYKDDLDDACFDSRFSSNSFVSLEFLKEEKLNQETSTQIDLEVTTLSEADKNFISQRQRRDSYENFHTISGFNDRTSQEEPMQSLDVDSASRLHGPMDQTHSSRIGAVEHKSTAIEGSPYATIFKRATLTEDQSAIHGNNAFDWLLNRTSTDSAITSAAMTANVNTIVGTASLNRSDSTNSAGLVKKSNDLSELDHLLDDLLGTQSTPAVAEIQRVHSFHEKMNFSDNKLDCDSAKESQKDDLTERELQLLNELRLAQERLLQLHLENATMTSLSQLLPQASHNYKDEQFERNYFFNSEPDDHSSNNDLLNYSDSRSCRNVARQVQWPSARSHSLNKIEDRRFVTVPHDESNAKPLTMVQEHVMTPATVPTREHVQVNSNHYAPSSRKFVDLEKVLITQEDSKSQPYSARRANREEDTNTMISQHQHKIDHRLKQTTTTTTTTDQTAGEGYEEIETITLQPIGKGILDLESGRPVQTLQTTQQNFSNSMYRRQPMTSSTPHLASNSLNANVRRNDYRAATLRASTPQPQSAGYQRYPSMTLPSSSGALVNNNNNNNNNSLTTNQVYQQQFSEQASPGHVMYRRQQQQSYEYHENSNAASTMHNVRSGAFTPTNGEVFHYGNNQSNQLHQQNNNYSAPQHGPISPNSGVGLMRANSVGGVPGGLALGGWSRTSSFCGSSEAIDATGAPRFVQDTSRMWYKPEISRDEAINFLRDKAPGSFIVRDSHSYPGGFGLAVRVAQLPPGVQARSGSDADPTVDLVRHYLVEPTSRGVRLKGCSNEPIFSSLAALVYQHTLTPLALPCRLILPDMNPQYQQHQQHLQPQQHQQQHYLSEQLSPNIGAAYSQSTTPNDILQRGAACNVLFLGSVEVESLTGSNAIGRAVQLLLNSAPVGAIRTTECHLKVASDGVTLTDIQRKLFFRRHYPVNTVSFCGLDPKGRCFDAPETRARGLNNLFIFGFVVRKSATSLDNVCHLLCEVDPSQPAKSVIKFVMKHIIRQ